MSATTLLGRPADLVGALRGGDHDALDLLCERYGRLILLWAAGEGADAEDVLQEVLFRVWRAGPRLDERTDLPAYLKTVTRNVLKDRWRTAGRKHAVPAGLEPAAARGDDPTPEHTSRIAVEQLMSGLATRERDVLRMLYLSDLTMDEAAERLGVSPEAAKSLAARARRRLRRNLELTVATGAAATLALLVGRAAEATWSAVRRAVFVGVAALTAVTGSASSDPKPAPEPTPIVRIVDDPHLQTGP